MKLNENVSLKVLTMKSLRIY